MNAPAGAQPVPSSPNLIAPLWHTALFLLALGGLATWGAHRQGLPAFGASRATSYLVTIANEWLQLGVAAWGIRLGGVSIKSVIGGRWSKPIDLLRDLGIGIIFLVGSNIVLIALSAALGAGPNANVSRILPQSKTEITVWILFRFPQESAKSSQQGDICKNSSAAYWEMPRLA